MRSSLVVLSLVSTLGMIVLACGGAEVTPTPTPEPPPRDLGPVEVGPVAPELRHVDTETYTIDVEGPPSGKVKEKIVATITVKTKGDLALQNPTSWKLEAKGPGDVDITQPVMATLPPAVTKTTVKYQVTVVALRAGTKHVGFNVGGSVCDADFCDVVAEQVSFNLDVK
jgi:hypothetical protein